MKRARSLLIAFVALALSAGAAFAGRDLPAAATSGLDRAADVSGQDVPVRAGSIEAPTPDVAPGAQAEAADADEQEDAPDVVADGQADNHGATVSAAAKGDPPSDQASQFANHGAWVRSVALQNHGRDTAATKRPSVGKAGH